MNTCGSNTSAFNTVSGGMIAGQAVVSPGYPSQGGGGRKSRKKSTRRSARRSTRRFAPSIIMIALSAILI